MIPRRDRDLPSALLAGAAWFWGAQLTAGALLSAGVGAGPAQLLGWLGVVGAGWAIARLGLAGAWGRVTLAAVLVVLPAAISVVTGRVVRAASTGLRIDASSLASDVAWQALPPAASLVAVAVACAQVSRAFTSGWRRSPT